MAVHVHRQSRLSTKPSPLQRNPSWRRIKSAGLVKLQIIKILRQQSKPRTDASNLF